MVGPMAQQGAFHKEGRTADLAVDLLVGLAVGLLADLAVGLLADLTMTHHSIQQQVQELAATEEQEAPP